jgi:2-polyprenyl-6-methoxyphenol hydroxylase-like FAD-dependent oxidoreductase
MTTRQHDIVIVGAGSGGIALAASLLKRQPKLDIAIIEPSDKHYYQPACAMATMSSGEAWGAVANSGLWAVAVRLMVRFLGAN